MKICIVGAGVAGIQTAYSLAKSGHDCHIYESSSEAGGVWLKNYDGFGLQVLRHGKQTVRRYFPARSACL